MGSPSDNPLKRLIREIHRRTLWQVLGIYVVASFAVLEGIETLGGVVPLPDWFSRLALALLVVGLPVVLATAFVQEGGPGRDAGDVEVAGAPTKTPPPGGASGLFTWRNAFGGGVLGFALLGFVGTGWVLFGGGFGSGTPDSSEFTRQQLTGFLVREHSPSWSPDGGLVTFGYTEHGHMDIYVMSVPDGEPLRLTDDPPDDTGPRWSPAGDRIAFLSDRGANMRLFVIPPTGGSEREVADTGISAVGYGGMFWFLGLGSQPWSPDGTQLLFSRRDSTDAVGIWKVNVSTGELTQMTRPPPGQVDMGASWSPDGSTLAFDRGQLFRSGLWTMPANGGDPEPVVESQSWNLRATFRPQGTALVFVSNRTGALNLWEIDLDSGQETPVTTGVQDVYGLDVSRSGDIVYSVGSHVTNLYLGSLDTPTADHVDVTRNTSDDYGVRASPDGRLLYHSDRLGSYDIWTHDPATGEGQALTQDPATDFMPDRLPNGRIVFVSDREGGVLRLWTMTETGSEIERFGPATQPFRCGFGVCRVGPNVSPDGQLVGFIAEGERGQTLWVIGSDGRDLRATTLPGGIYAFDWYRDSRRVVYTRSADDGSGRLELRAYHLTTGEDALVFEGPVAEPAVTLDGATVAFLNAASHYNQDVFTLQLSEGEGGLPSAIGEPEQLTEGQGLWHVHNFAWFPDGVRFAYTKDTDDGDIYVLRPVR